jgi:hypothetical protein
MSLVSRVIVVLPVDSVIGDHSIREGTRRTGGVRSRLVLTSWTAMRRGPLQF